MVENTKDVAEIFDSALAHETLAAIKNPEKWQRVLQHIMNETGAKAAMITLRDSKTCQIIRDDALESEYHSPLICGFSMPAVVFYLEQLRAIDPWADAQLVHYPARPLLMSAICPPDSLEDTRFFDWLKSYGLEESIVVELGQVPGYWSALNLFMEKPESEKTHAALDYVKNHFLYLRQAWQLTQMLTQSDQSSQAILDQMEVAACVINAGNEIIMANKAFSHLKKTGAVRVSSPSKRLSVPHNALFPEQTTAASHAISQHDAPDASQISLTIEPFNPDPLYKEKREPLRLVILATQAQKSHGDPLQKLNIQLLTGQERRMFDAVRTGSTVIGAGVLIGVKKSRANKIWASVKEKLGIANAHQIRPLSTA